MIQSSILIIEMLSPILLPFLRRTFSNADRFTWLSLTFDTDKEVLTGRSATLDHLSFLAYLIHVALQAYGILLHNSHSTHVTQIISAMFCLPYVVTMVISLYWEADRGAPALLNVMTKCSADPVPANG